MPIAILGQLGTDMLRKSRNKIGLLDCLLICSNCFFRVRDEVASIMSKMLNNHRTCNLHYTYSLSSHPRLRLTVEHDIMLFTYQKDYTNRVGVGAKCFIFWCCKLFLHFRKLTVNIKYHSNMFSNEMEKHFTHLPLVPHICVSELC